MTIQIRNAYPAPGGGASLSWQSRLNAAQEPDEVVTIARDFLARLSPEEYSRLPDDCRPRKLVDADDVVDYAVTLVRRSCEADRLADALVHQMAAFFTDASRRFSQLAFLRAATTPEQ
jgi:hypothetical protein